MADNTITRRSGRQRVPNKKYQQSAETLERLKIVLSSDSEEDLLVKKLQADAKGDDDFLANQAILLSDSPESLNSDASQKSDGSAIATPIEVYQDAHLYASSAPEASQRFEKLAKRKLKAKKQYRARNQATKSRGIPENPLKADSKAGRLDLLSGPDKKDIMHFVRSRKQWGSELTLPKRSRMRLPFSHTEEKRSMEATVGWDWYYEQGGKEMFAKRQTMRVLSADEGLEHMPKHASHDFLMGPYGRQSLFSLSTWGSLNVDDAWNAAVKDHGSDYQEEPGKWRRQGWMLNIGCRVRCLDWATNHDGDTQYLAIATKNAIAKRSLKDAPAFTPTPASPSSVQIWSFGALSEKPAMESSMDQHRAPELKQVLCTTWGDAKQLKWCPMPRTFRNEETDGRVPLGLLAGVWDDGCARVLDIQLDRIQRDGTSYLIVDSAAFAAHPPSNSICTCLTWLSATDLAIGHSNGFLSIYSITPTLPPPLPLQPNNIQDPSDRTNPPIYSKPWLHTAIHQTYIVALTSAYPSFPTLLASASMSGHTRLTSLTAPQTSYVQSRRTHTAVSTVIYHDALYGCVFPDDGKENVSLTGLRFWGNAIAFGDAAAWGGLLSLDVGKVHAAVAFGTADGRVVVTNPFRKALHRRTKAYQQTIFRHEWVRRRQQPGSDAVAEGAGGESPRGRCENKREGRSGISRITEGYKPQIAEVESRASSRSLISGTGRGGRSSATTTIFEEETGATAISWNPNLTCGGWIAVGWGSGLVRIEDVGL